MNWKPREDLANWSCRQCGKSPLLQYDDKLEVKGDFYLPCRYCKAMNRMHDGETSLVKDQ